MRIAAAALFWLLLGVVPGLAREKTDVLVMTNGDRFTCEIKGLDAGTLYVSDTNNQRIRVCQLRRNRLLRRQHGVQSRFFQQLHAAFADLVRYNDFHESSSPFSSPVFPENCSLVKELLILPGKGN